MYTTELAALHTRLGKHLCPQQHALMCLQKTPKARALKQHKGAEFSKLDIGEAAQPLQGYKGLSHSSSAPGGTFNQLLAELSCQVSDIA